MPSNYIMRSNYNSRPQRAANFQRWMRYGNMARSAVNYGRSAAQTARGMFNTFTPPSSPPFRITSGQMEVDTNNVPTSGLQTYGGSASKPIASQYRRRLQPKYKRDEAKKYYDSFLKTYRKVSGVALQKVVINSTAAATAVIAAQQWVATHLGSYVSTVTDSRETGQRDLRQVLDSMSNTKYTDDVDNSSRRLVDNAICDMTITNTGIGRIEVDKYVIEYSDDFEIVNLATLFVNASNNQVSLTSIATDRLTINDRGVTLFDLSYFLSVGKIKILSKDKVFMAAGDSANFREIVNKKITININEIQGETTYVKNGYTRTILFVFKSVVGDTNTAALSLGSTRSYGFRVDGQSIQGNAKLIA